MTAITGQRTDQIRVAGKGKVLINSTVGAAGPANTTDPWAAGWVDLGYLTDAGVVFSKKDTFDGVPLWQSMADGRKIPKSRVVQFKFELVQLNSVTWSLWAGGNAVAANGSVTGEYVLDIDADADADERALGIEWQDNNGTITYRATVAKVQVVDSQDVTIGRTKAIGLGLTLEALTFDPSTPLVHMIGKDGNLAI
jgi:hypothetical protein